MSEGSECGEVGYDLDDCIMYLRRSIRETTPKITDRSKGLDPASATQRCITLRHELRSKAIRDHTNKLPSCIKEFFKCALRLYQDIYKAGSNRQVPHMPAL